MENLNRLITWMNTFKQSKGYGGPVTHYWGDSFSYIGPSFDWRNEGIAKGYAALYRKTGQREFLDLAIECADFICAAQLADGRLPNSGFESNPSLRETYQPHQSANLLALLEVISLLKDLGRDYSKYMRAAQLSRDYIVSNFFDPQLDSFVQYEFDRAKKVPNPIVPNKIATMGETILAHYNLTKDENSLKMARFSADKIISLQEKREGELFGGIYQSNVKDSIITYYTARCVPFLCEFSKVSKDKKYLEGAENAVLFAKKMWRGDGFEFGFSIQDFVARKLTYPIFYAGGADILRAILVLEGRVKPNYLSWLFEGQNKTGGFRNFSGLAHKNTQFSGAAAYTWRDYLPSVGWNDKVLRLLALLVQDDFSYAPRPFDDEKIKLDKTEYYENKDFIKIGGTENFVFGKSSMFPNGHQLLKNTAYRVISSGIFARANSFGKFFIRKAGEL